jgi:hypothetical protein
MAADENMGEEQLTRIYGIVLAAGWKKNGDVSEVDLADYDEKKYRVVNDARGRRLRPHIQSRVVVDGFVSQLKDRLTIKIHHFAVDTSCPPHPPLQK